MPKIKRLLSVFSCITFIIFVGQKTNAQENQPVQTIPAYYPQRAPQYSNYEIGFIHGVQYWVNSDANIRSIEDDFRKISQEDYINGIRLPFWALFYYVKGKTLKDEDFKLADLCFDLAEKYNLKINPVLPQIQGWLDGSADDPNIRADYKQYIQIIVRHFKDKKALAMWTVDIEPSRSYKIEPTDATLSLYRNWLKKRYSCLDEFKKFNPGMENFDAAYVVKSPWHNFQQHNDYLTFTACALAEQTLFIANTVKEIDPIHPTSCTPPDVLHNQLIENGRNMWWLADTIDYPGSQMHAHWHLETADMPADVLIAQACSIKKVYNSARGRAASYIGEVLAGPELAFESTRFYTPAANELLCTTLCHLAEGVKGYFYWIWNPTKETQLAGAWAYREIDGSPSERSTLLSNFGKMVVKNNDLLYTMRPEDTHVAIFDSMDAAIYLGKKSNYHPMSEWYVKNQYGFYKALRKTQIPCDFIDEITLLSGAASKYSCIYVPFSITMEQNIADALINYVKNGGTVIADCMTAFTPRYHMLCPHQPGLGLQEAFGLKALSVISAYDGWTEIMHKNNEQYFDRILTNEKNVDDICLFDNKGNKGPLIVKKIYQPVQPTTAKVLFRDIDNRPVCTVNNFGKGFAIWTGTMLGFTCRDADIPYERYEAVADLIRPYIPKTKWKITAPDNTIICRRLRSDEGELFVLINEGKKQARFTLDFGSKKSPQELLWTDRPCWKPIMFSKQKIAGVLKPLDGTVIYCPR